MQGVKGDKLIKEVLNSKKKLRSTGITVGFLNDNSGVNKLLVVISKKIFKKANKRNRLRRRIKALFIKHSGTVFKNHNVFCVQIFSKELLFLNNEDLEKRVLDIFYKILP
ncbi:MAG: ribonuclease P protein component [Patescibacteria group bacterium]